MLAAVGLPGGRFPAFRQAARQTAAIAATAEARTTFRVFLPGTLPSFSHNGVGQLPPAAGTVLMNSVGETAIFRRNP